MTGPLDRDWLRRWAITTRYVTRQTISDNPSTCILTTRIGLRVLERVGVKARPQPVAVAVENAAARRLRDQGVPPSQWPDEAWSVGVHPQQHHSGTGWNGHLVLLVRTPDSMQTSPNPTPRTLVDLTADQFDRPAKGISIGGPVVFGIGGEQLWTPQDPLGIVVTDEETQARASVTYWPMPPGAPQAKAYRVTPDWNLDPVVLDGFADSVLAALAEADGIEGDSPSS